MTWNLLCRSTLSLFVLSTLVTTGCGVETPSKPKATNDQSDTKGTDSTEVPRADGLKSPTKVEAPKIRTPSPEQVAKWGLVDFTPLQLLACNDGFSDPSVRSLAPSVDGKQFVLGGAKLMIWNSTESQPVIDVLAVYKSGDVKRPIHCVAMSPNGIWFAAGDDNGKLRIWNLSDQKEQVAIQAHDGRLTQLSFSPNSQILATTSYSGEVRFWNSTNGKKIKSLKISDREVARIAFLSDNLLATAGQEVAIWNIESGLKEKVLTNGNVIGPSLAVSKDRGLLAFGDSDSSVRLWNVEKSELMEVVMRGVSAHWIDVSHDGKLLATYSSDSTIRIWDVASGNLMQVIDADGDRTSALKWLPESNALLVASERGRVRIWGTLETSAAIGLQPLDLPMPRSESAKDKKSMTSGEFQRVIDVRSFPRLPGAVPVWSDYSTCGYNAVVTQNEAEMFYRYVLGKNGWTESTVIDPFQPGLTFHKDGCQFNVSVGPSSTLASGKEPNLQITLNFAGNYDVRWLPKFSEIKSKSSWASFSSVSYRTKASLTDVEVGLLKQFYAVGWTAYSRLAASSSEQPRSRLISMLQGGSVLKISIGVPADAPDELAVQISVNVANKSLPLPTDSGWIEFDSSTDLQLVATTKMNLAKTIEFFDRELAAEGWLARDAGRFLKEAKTERDNVEPAKAWLPYVRGQQDVIIRLVALSDDRTRVVVGDAERSSWQLKEPEKVTEKAEKAGIEAADFELPKGATAIKFDVDGKQIQFEFPGITPPKLGEVFVKQMDTLEWKRESAGVTSDEYVFVTFSKSKTEIQIRIRADGKKSTAMISGDGLLWSKSLPTPPVRISYETWLRRGHKDATLDQLDEFAAEMKLIPAGK